MAVVWKTDGVIESSAQVYFPNGTSEYFNNYSAIYTYNLSSELANLESLYGADNYTIDSAEFILNDHFLLKSYQATGNYFIQYSSSSTSSISTNNAITNLVAINYSSVSSNTSLTGTSFPISTGKFSSFISTAEAGSFSVRIAKQNISGSSTSDRVYYGPTSSNPIGTMTCKIKYSYKVTVPDPTLTAPSNLRFYNYTAGDAQYYLTWDRAIGSNGTGEVTYFVAERTTQTTLSSWKTDTIIGPFTSPPAGTTYQFSIYAQYSGITNTSAPTYSLTFKAASAPALGTPSITSLIPTTGSTSYTISWNSVAGATSYKVKYRLSGSSSWSSTGNIYSTTYSGSVSSFGTWQFQIEASNGTSTTTSAIVSTQFSAASVLQPPTELSVVPASAGSLNYTFSWNEATGGTGPYYYSPYCDGIQLTGYNTSTSYSGTVTSYGEHIFKVKVYDIGGRIVQDSNEYTYNFTQAAQQLQAPTITSITQTPANSLNYTVTWSAATGGTGSKKYLLICDGSGVGGLTSGLQASGSVSAYGEHTFKVLVIDDVGTTAYSREVKHVFTAAPVVTDPTLNPPSNLKITHVDGSSQFTLTWDAAQASGGSGIVTYHIEKLVNGEWDFLDFSNGLNLTETEYSGTIPGWGEQTLAVYAMYGDLAKRASITHNFKSTAATKIAPEIIDIDYSPGDTQFYITWSEAYDSSFSGIFYYNVRNVSTNTKIVANSTDTGAWVAVPGYDIKYQFDVYANYTLGSISSTKTFEYTFDSIPPITLEAPGAPTITQSSAQATFSASWTRAVASDGGTNISYSVYCGDSQIGASTTALSLSNLPIPNYNTNNDFYIKASYSGVNISSPITAARFSVPSITTPIVSITPTEGSNVKVSWTEAKLAYTTGDITYKLYCKKNSKETSSAQIHYGDIVGSLEKDISETWLSTKGSDGDIFYFQVDAVATNLSHIANNNASLTAVSGFAPGFTFKVGNSVGYYYNGAWQECTVYYYGWNSTTQQYEWIECIPYYYKDGWQEINTKIE